MMGEIINKKFVNRTNEIIVVNDPVWKYDYHIHPGEEFTVMIKCITINGNSISDGLDSYFKKIQSIFQDFPSCQCDFKTVIMVKGCQCGNG